MDGEWIECQGVEKILWDNLVGSGLLEEILAHSQHAAEPSEYTHVKIWSELDTARHDYKSGLWLQVKISAPEVIEGNCRMGRQPVTPKLYRLTDSLDEQRSMAKRIWAGVDLETLYSLALNHLAFLDKKRRWLTTEGSAILKGLYPAAQRRQVEFELMPLCAQYRIRVKD